MVEVGPEEEEEKNGKEKKRKKRKKRERGYGVLSPALAAGGDRRGARGGR